MDAIIEGCLDRDGLLVANWFIERGYDARQESCELERVGWRIEADLGGTHVVVSSGSSGSGVAFNGKELDGVDSVMSELDDASGSREPEGGEEDMERRGLKAAVRFLERRGYGILDKGWSSEFGIADIVADDDGTVVFVHVATKTMGQGLLPDSSCGMDRPLCEAVAADYLGAHMGLVDCPVRFDRVDLLVVSADRAMLRHSINCFGVD